MIEQTFKEFNMFPPTAQNPNKFLMRLPNLRAIWQLPRKTMKVVGSHAFA